jgi:hypothetical protein
MKKLVFASVMALASLSLVYAPTLRAQDLSIKDPAEYNAYQMATTQSDPKAKAAALEQFLVTYPQSVAKKVVLDALVDTYQALNDGDHALSAASRLLQVDPQNMKAVYISAVIKKAQCGRTQDAQTCDDGAALARKGLATAKPAGTSDDDWKKLTGATYPVYHSVIALDDAISKKDYKAAEDEYTQELMLYNDDQSKTAGLADTLQLATAYSLPGAGQDLVKSVWFFARVWDFAPQAYKTQIEPKLEYYYTKYHGKLDGLDAIKTQAAATTFPPGAFVIAPAPTPAERIHTMLTDPSIVLSKLALSDKETILALGSKDDAEKIWAVMKDQQTPVPGVVLSAPVSGLKIAITQAAKTADFVVALKAPMACADIPEATATADAKKQFILANGVQSDIDKIEALSPDYKKPITKFAVEGTDSVIKVAVTQDAKDAKTPDFIVNLKEPAPCKDVPAVGSEFKLQPATELDGTYDTYRQIPATATVAQTAEIVLREGFIQDEKKKTAAPVHHTAPAHRPASH